MEHNCDVRHESQILLRNLTVSRIFTFFYYYNFSTVNCEIKHLFCYKSKTLYITYRVGRKIRFIEGIEKCYHLKKIDLQRDFAAGLYLSEAQHPMLPPTPLTHALYTCIHYTYSQRERGRVEPERRGGGQQGRIQITKLG
jgi:hypothetical protein